MVTTKASIESANPSSTSSVMVTNFLSSQLTTIRQIKTGGNVRQVNDIEEKGTCDNQTILKREGLSQLSDIKEKSE